MNNKGHCYSKSIILQTVYFKPRFTLSYWDVEEIMKMREVEVDHATIQRWVFKFSPFIDWCYLYRAVDKIGKTVDFLLTRRRQRMSAQSFLIKAINNNGKPRVIAVDKSGSNRGAIIVYNNRSYSHIKIGQCKYLNNIVEQDHRFFKWRIRNGLGF